tara:strand:+ start:1553 stop:1693 length:141 start_codon:yes stop_codon:yes gene_type:complete
MAFNLYTNPHQYKRKDNFERRLRMLFAASMTVAMYIAVHIAIALIT